METTDFDNIGSELLNIRLGFFLFFLASGSSNSCCNLTIMQKISQIPALTIRIFPLLPSSCPLAVPMCTSISSPWNGRPGRGLHRSWKWLHVTGQGILKSSTPRTWTRLEIDVGSWWTYLCSSKARDEVRVNPILE